MAIIALTVFFRTEMKYGQIADGGKFFGALFFSLINVMFNGMAELAMTVLGFLCSTSREISYSIQHGLLDCLFGSSEFLSH